MQRVEDGCRRLIFMMWNHDASVIGFGLCNRRSSEIQSSRGWQHLWFWLKYYPQSILEHCHLIAQRVTGQFWVRPLSGISIHVLEILHVRRRQGVFTSRPLGWPSTLLLTFINRQVVVIVLNRWMECEVVIITPRDPRHAWRCVCLCVFMYFFLHTNILNSKMLILLVWWGHFGWFLWLFERWDGIRIKLGLVSAG